MKREKTPSEAFDKHWEKMLSKFKKGQKLDKNCCNCFHDVDRICDI